MNRRGPARLHGLGGGSVVGSAVARGLPSAPDADGAVRTPVGARIEEHLVGLLEPRSAEAEAYRAVRVAIDRFARPGAGAVVAVTSARDGDGKTTTAINLAGAIAHGRTASVLLVDADLRKAALAELVGVSPDTGGLSEALTGVETSLEPFVRSGLDETLDIVVTGRTVASPPDVLRGSRLADMLGDARRRYDYVILDAPSLVPHPDCRLLRPVVDAFVVVVAPGRTPRTLLADALDTLDAGAPAMFLLNHLERRIPGPRPRRTR